MKKTFNFRHVWQQIKADAIGKDSYRGITLTYAWMANQFGHIALGFIPSFLIFHFCIKNSVTSATYVSLFWLAFEILNFLLPLIYKKSKYSFKPSWLNITFDTFTDVCFFSFGAFLFSLSITKFTNNLVNIVLFLLLVYLIFATKYWFITKMYQLNAKYPFQFRLAQWNLEMSEKNILTVKEYNKSQKSDGNHLLVYGNFGAGKTTLSVGILNELSIKHNRCLYKSGNKMFNSFFNDHNNSNDVWNWKTSDFLLIDDINPSEPIAELTTPKKLLTFIDTFQPKNHKNRKIIKEKNIIWVLGSKPDLSNDHTDKWIQFLLEIGVSKSKISSINLSE